MKVFWRILYAFVAVAFFMFSMDLSNNLISAEFFNKYGPDAVAQKDDLFVYGGSGFHTHTPMVNIEAEGYFIRFYEINKLFQHNKTGAYKVETYVYIIIYDDNNTIKPSSDKSYYLSFQAAGDDNFYDIEIRRFRELDVFIGIHTEGNDMTALLAQSAFLDKTFNRVQITKETTTAKEVLLDSSFSISEDDFIGENVLLNHYDNRNDYGVYDKTEHDASEFQYMIYIVSGVYVILLIVATYLTFFVDYQQLAARRYDRKYGRQEK